MRPIEYLTTLLTMCTLLTALHLQDDTQKQIEALKSRQSKFQSKINKIVNDVNQVDRKVQNSKDIDQKVMILEKAILSQRQQIFQLSKVIIPPFNMSKASCEKMTDQQKVALLDDLSEARKQVKQLKNITQGLPDCDDKQFMLSDINKQTFFLDSIQSIIYTNCSMNIILSPTIFQTNIYAPNWTLGSMTIDDLIQQYYQRSIRYENITNCPIGYPFFNGKKCITCDETKPVFQISSKKCVQCPEDHHVDNRKKMCVPDVKYTDWDSVDNYVSDGKELPKSTDPNAKACPVDKPYTNGTKCIECSFPNYWNVSNQSCETCPQNQTFSKNAKKCEVIEKNHLTKLSGTRWVTSSNTTAVLQERVAILKQNQTTKNYHECPDDKPYYDNLSCVACPDEFDLDTFKCVNATDGKVYDHNVHKYLKPMPGYETEPSADNLLGSPSADHPNIHNCNQTHPYYDGVSCIKCDKPFTLFDVAYKRCSACPAQKMYNSTSRACEPRKVIFISQNDQKLMATPSVSIEDYNAEVTNKSNNSQAIVLNCSQPQQYSNFKKCFTCKQNQYFNVELKKCEQCKELNETTKICKGTFFLTNLNDTNIVYKTNKTDELAKQAKIKQASKSVEICPIETPYFNGSAGIKCQEPDIFFSMEQKNCTGCPPHSFYRQGACYQISTLSNISALNNSDYIQGQNITLQNQSDYRKKLQKNNIPYEQCPQNKPYFNKTLKTCVVCHNDTYLNLETKKCVVCDNYDNKTRKCAEKQKVFKVSNITALKGQELLENDNNTLDALAKQIKENYTDKGIKTQACPAEQPFYNTTTKECSNCTPPQHIDLQSSTCRVCETYSKEQKKCIQIQKPPKYPNLNKKEWITTNDTIEDVYDMRNSLAKVPGATQCPLSKPFYSNITKQCQTCLADTYFNYLTSKCESCDPKIFDVNSHRCISQQHQTSPNSPYLINDGISSSQYAKIYNQNKQKYPEMTDCPPQTPYFDGGKCIQCKGAKMYFNLKNRQCVSCPNGTTYDSGKRECIEDKQSVVNEPNPAEMYANIFHHANLRAMH